MYKHEIKLKQHTPIIHFQHDERGATLRATELKPKLDRYLIQNVFGNDRNKFKKYLIGQHDALNYKVAITRIGQKIDQGPIGGFPLYFGNMGNDRASFKELVHYEGVNIHLFSYHSDLVQTIDDHFSSFLWTTNFGMRQSKGFGCFMSEKIESVPEKFYRFTVDTEDYIEMFSTIELFYKSLRSGINGGNPPSGGRFTQDFYMKPMIFLYAKDNNVQWEKKSIKEEFYTGQNGEDKLNNQRNKRKNQVPLNEEPTDYPLWYESEDKKIVRDLLGLSTEQSWKGYPREGKDAKLKKEFSHTIDYRMPNNQSIARFKSPILFKPIWDAQRKRFQVYFKASPIPSIYQNAFFNISADGQNMAEPMQMWNDFDMDAFLRFAFQRGTLDRAIKLFNPKDRSASAINSTLKRIYNQLENQ